MGEQSRRDAIEVQMERNAVVEGVRALRQQDAEMRRLHPDMDMAAPPGWAEFQEELLALMEKHAATLDIPLECLGRTATAFMIVAGHAFGSLLAEKESAASYLNQTLNMAAHAFGAGMATGHEAATKGRPVN